MKVRILKSGKFSFSPAEKAVDLKQDEVLDLPDTKASLLINVKWAKEEKVFVEENTTETSVEGKMQDTSSEENKAIDLTKISNKLFKRRRGRPPKAK